MGLRLTKYCIKKCGSKLHTCQQNYKQKPYYEKDLEFINRLNKIKVLTITQIPVDGANKNKKQRTNTKIDCSPGKFAPDVFGCLHISEICIKSRLYPDSWTPEEMRKELKISSSQAHALNIVLDHL